jgi:hypothetical protein
VVSPPLSDSNDSSRSADMVAVARRARRRGAFRGCRRDLDADSPGTSADASCLDGPEVFARELALDEDLWEAAALVGRRRAGRISSSLSAARAAFNVCISSFSSRIRLSIDSTISWVVRMLLMLRTHAAGPGCGPGRLTPRRAADPMDLQLGSRGHADGLNDGRVRVGDAACFLGRQFRGSSQGRASRRASRFLSSPGAWRCGWPAMCSAPAASMFG